MISVDSEYNENEMVKSDGIFQQVFKVKDI